MGKLNDWGLQLGLFANQAANQVEATPCGSAGIPTLRGLCSGDLPPINLALVGSNGGVTGILPLAEGGTGTATPSLIAGTNITLSGTWPNQTINASGSSGSGTVISGIAGQVGCYAATGTAISGCATLPTTAMPALAGDVTGTAGSLSLTVAKVNGAAVPASATFVGSNSSGQLTALTAANAQAALVAANAQTYSPTLASGVTNDWDPSGGAGITTVGFVSATPNAAGSTVDGVAAGSDKQQFVLCNAAALGINAEYIILENQSSSDATAANRLAMAGNVALGPQMCATFTYVAGSIDRWLVSAIANARTAPTDPLAAGTSMTPDCSFWRNTIAVSTGTAITVNAPTDCSPQEGQKLELDITSASGGAAAYTWNATYVASATLAIPTTANAASKQDRFLFAWSSLRTAWVLLAYNQGF